MSSLIGKMVGNFKVLELLGEGGMGKVYLGEHPTIRSRVAVKVLLPRYVSNASIVRRFLDEARAVNRIGHQGVVRIHDCNQEPDVGVYLVMELLEGHSIADRMVTAGVFEPLAAARLVQQAASALGASHAAGIIHRDLKPANLYLVPDPDVIGGERIKILDFGIAKLLEGAGGVDGTQTGAVIGSPMYMSPEQCIDSKNVDHRTDIYSLGAIAYQMLSGKLPYQAKTLGKLILAQQRDTPAALGSLNPAVPPALEAAVHRALSVERERRFQSMQELWEALREAAPAEAAQPAPVADPKPPAPARMVSITAPAAAPRQTSEPSPAAPAPASPELAELEVTGDTTLSGSAGERQAATGAGRRYVIGALLVLLGGGAIAGGLVLMGVRGGEARAPQQEPAPVLAAAGSEQQPATDTARQGQRPATEAPPPRVVSITLQVSPHRARVLLDGQRVDQRTLKLPLSSQPRTIRVEAPGYVPRQETFTPDADRTLRYFLERKRRARPRKAGGG
jgi:serine/threonine-protein kinase